MLRLRDVARGGDGQLGTFTFTTPTRTTTTTSWKCGYVSSSDTFQRVSMDDLHKSMDDPQRFAVRSAHRTDLGPSSDTLHRVSVDDPQRSTGDPCRPRDNNMSAPAEDYAFTPASFLRSRLLLPKLLLLLLGPLLRRSRGN